MDNFLKNKYDSNPSDFILRQFQTTPLSEEEHDGPSSGDFDSESLNSSSYDSTLHQQTGPNTKTGSGQPFFLHEGKNPCAKNH